MAIQDNKDKGHPPLILIVPTQRWCCQVERWALPRLGSPWKSVQVVDRFDLLTDLCTRTASPETLWRSRRGIELGERRGRVRPHHTYLSSRDDVWRNRSRWLLHMCNRNAWLIQPWQSRDVQWAWYGHTVRCKRRKFYHGHTLVLWYVSWMRKESKKI
jgi:hypothetical protein